MTGGVFVVRKFKRPEKGENIMRRKLIVIAVLLLFLVPLISGCSPIELPTRIIVNGGGWIDASLSAQSVMAETEVVGKATFGFTFDMYDIVWGTEAPTDYKVRGHLTYVDHVTGEKVIGPITDILMVEPGGITGTYGKGAGTFTFMPIDGDPDEFHIELSTGYINSGMLEGGNIETVMFYD